MFQLIDNSRSLLAILALSILALGACAADNSPAEVNTPASSGAETIVLYWLEGTELRGVSHTLRQTDRPAEAALKAMLAGPPSGYETAIPTPEEVVAYPGRQPDWGERVRLLDLTVQDGVATANFSQEMQAYGGGSARVQAIRQQITETLLQFPTIDDVRIAVEGEVETALQP